MADVLYGVDNAFLSRALAEDIFLSYDSPMLEQIPAAAHPMDVLRTGCSMLGAVLPERSRISFRVNEPAKRPVSAVADQKEFRDIAEVHLEIARESQLTLLFDPGHALDERIVAEQFAV